MDAIRDAVSSKIQSMIDDGSLQKKIEDGVEKAINHAIDEQFQKYGPIVRDLEQQLKEKLQLDFSALPFDTYNKQMAVALKQRFGQFFHAEAAARFFAEIDEVLAPAPAEVDINDFVETIVGFWKSDDPFYYDQLDDNATVEISDRGRHSKTLKMWKKKEAGGYHTSRNSADIELFIMNNKITVSHNQRFNPTCLSQETAYIFKLYAAGTLITGIDEFDENNCNLELKEDYD